MSRSSTMLGSLFVLSVLFAICANAATVRVRMVDGPPYYDPARIEINVGDTVEWMNTGPTMQHVLTNEDATFFSNDVPVGKAWSFTFTKAGIYEYLCFRHFFMKGQVIVHNKDGTTTAKADTPYEGAFKEFVVPTRDAIPRMIIASRVDDSMWFTEGGGDFYGFEDIPPQNKLAQIDATGRIVEYATPDPDGSKVGVDSLVMDREGTIWFTERITNRIGKLQPGKSIQQFPLSTAEGYALGVDLDSKGNLWFAQRYGNRLGWMSADGKFEEMELPDKNSEPRTVFVDSKDRVWYTAREANQIGYLEAGTRKLHRLRIPTEIARPAGVCEGRDGAIYFVEMVGNKLARVREDMSIVEYPLPTKFSAPFKCATDPQGNIWFTQVFGNSIGRFDPQTEQVVEYKIPTQDSRPGGIAIDRKGRIWFTEQKGNKIGMFDPAEADQLIRAAAQAQSDAVTSDTKPAEQQPIAQRVNHEGQPAALGVLIEDFQVPTAGAGPGNDLVDDGNGKLWFTELFGNKVASFDRHTGQFSEIELPTPVSMPVGLVRDADGIVWVSLFRGNGVARIDPRSGAVEEHHLKTESALPSGITVDENNQVWIAQLGANRIARLDRATRAFEEFSLPGKDNGPLQIVADRRGSLWISASDDQGNALLRFDLARKSFEAFALPTPAAGPVGILVDGDTLWVAEGAAGKLASFDVKTRKWTEHVIPGEGAEPVKLAKDSRGRVWLTDGGGLGSSGGNRLLVFDPATKAFSAFAMRKREAKPMGIVHTSDGHIWFTQQGANRISRITPEAQQHARNF